jgi:hypothetical protein
MLQAYSAPPFNITSGVTTVQGTAGRPIVDGEFIDRNSGEGSPFFSLNARVSYTFHAAGPLAIRSAGRRLQPDRSRQCRDPQHQLRRRRLSDEPRRRPSTRSLPSAIRARSSSASDYGSSPPITNDENDPPMNTIHRLQIRQSLAAFVLAAAIAQAVAAQTVTTLAVPNRANSTPWVAAAGSFVAVTWGAAVNGKGDIYLAVSRDGGHAFTAPVRVNSVGGDARISGEIAPRGRV